MNFYQILRLNQAIKKLKEEYPALRLRINYTFNKDNFRDLADFFDVNAKYQPDILQIRPVKNMGNTAYQDTDVSSLKDDYEPIINEILEEGKKREMTILASPKFKNVNKEDNIQSVIYQFVYYYMRPGFVWRDGFDWKNETFNEFRARTGWTKKLWNQAFASKKQYRELNRQTSLNYEVLN